MSKACLIDTTQCIGCRSCQISCKQWNGLKAETTAYTGRGLPLGLQNPTTLSANTFSLVSFHEVEDQKAVGGMRLISTKRQCMHCNEPACASACPVTALHKTKEGPVVYDSAKCLGCRYCMWACPFGVPTAEWDSLAPKIKKCTFCFDRMEEPAIPGQLNGQALGEDAKKRFAAAQQVPACVKTCPTGALIFGEREALLAEGHQRIQASPTQYVNHIYGEKEVGGTAVLYLASVPFGMLGMRTDLGEESYPARSAPAFAAVTPAAVAIGATLGGIYKLHQRKEAALKAQAGDQTPEHHVHFRKEAAKTNLWSLPNLVMLALMAWGTISFVARFALGLGGSTNLSDTYAWGLWIVFDLVWIALAAGAFATAGLIYVFHRKDLYPMGRGAVLMGLLSYSFVTVTLLADLGLPWHFYQLGLQQPEHSAMYEVSWCVGLYVTILFFEFMPVVFERWQMTKAAGWWRQGAPIYVVAALTLFIFLMSHSAIWAGIALVVFAAIAFFTKQPADEKPVPIMLAIAAVTLSTMHQSSLGSLFLLMPDKLSPLWWSPIIPIYFFLSSVAAGLSVVVLMELFISKTYARPMRMKMLGTMGTVVFWATLIYLTVRVTDVALRGQLANAFAGADGVRFIVELGLGGLVPLALLASRKLRERSGVLGFATFLVAGGIIFNRANVVLFSMNLRGPMPGIAPASYVPSLMEIGVSVGLLAATVFLFGLAARNMPVLSETRHGAEGKA